MKLGQLELISTQKTDSKLTLSGEEGYLKAETNLNTLCNDLYGKGEGAASARSLNLQDIDKLAGIINDADKQELDSSYGTWYRTKYDVTEAQMQYSTSTDYNPETGEGTWTDYENSGGYQSFKEPGKEEINSENYQDEEGNPIVAELKYDDYFYSIKKKVTQKTSDNISMASLIIYGLATDENGNDIPSAQALRQWVATTSVLQEGCYVQYGVMTISSGGILSFGLLETDDGVSEYSLSNYIRPVVTLKSNVKLVDNNNNGVLEVNGISEEEYINMSLKMNSAQQVTYGSIATFTLNIKTNATIATNNITAEVVESTGKEITGINPNVTVTGSGSSYTITIDTSTLPFDGTTFKIKIPAGVIVTETGASSEILISGEFFALVSE